MILENISSKQFMRLFLYGAMATQAAVIAIFAVWTRSLGLVLCTVVMAALLLLWLVLFLYYFQKKLVRFTDSLCKTLDDMMVPSRQPQGPGGPDFGSSPAEVNYEAETLLSRISHRLARLYNVMEEGCKIVEEERSKLQSLVSDISHQTKTSIANLKMLNDTMLTRQISTKNREEFLQAAAGQIDKLDFLVQAMVKTSRLETGVITLKKEPALVCETLVGAINGVLAAMEKKQIHLSVDCPENLTVPHDRRWTSEALFNLLDNGVKYTPPGGSLKVAVHVWEMYMKIDVTDTGRGIPENVQGAIFQRFFREEEVHDVDGIGIGLYLARQIITMQGGYIKVVSCVGKGSTFSVFLPVK